VALLIAPSAMPRHWLPSEKAGLKTRAALPDGQ
jgi:hypothetical protein